MYYMVIHHNKLLLNYQLEGGEMMGRVAMKSLKSHNCCLVSGRGRSFQNKVGGVICFHLLGGGDKQLKNKRNTMYFLCFVFSNHYVLHRNLLLKNRNPKTQKVKT